MSLLIAAVRAAFVALAYAASAGNCSDSNSQNQKALVLEQTHSILGALTTIISPTALRIEMQSPRGAFLIAKSPDWRVVLFNKQDNLGMDMPFKSYLAHQARWSYGHRSGDRMPPTEDIGQVNYLSRSCRKVGLLQVTANGTVDSNQRYSHIVYYLVDEPSVPLQALQILEKFMDAPFYKGVPVYIDDEMHKVSDRSLLAVAMPLITTTLRTKKIRSAQFSRRSFEYPINFKKVSFEVEIRYDSKNRKDIEEFLK